VRVCAEQACNVHGGTEIYNVPSFIPVRCSMPAFNSSLLFLLNHRSGRGGSRGGFRNGESMEESRESGTADRDRDREVEGRYGVLYEQRMNPFAEVIFL
jgi:hypothetical protein